ncbi:hypothetical protein Fcan01_11885, partial [Folsomia candida]
TITARHPLATYKPSFLGCRKRVHLTGLNRRQIKKAKIEQIKETLNDSRDDAIQKACDTILADYPLQDKEWLDEIARTCQVCKSWYRKFDDASRCVSFNHGYIRCYLCFQPFPSVILLVAHLESDHTPGTDDYSVSCTFCSKSVDYMNLSSHVIGFHLSDKCIGRREKEGRYHTRTQEIIEGRYYYG